MTINNFLVKQFKISKEASVELISGGRVIINNDRAFQRQRINESDLIEVEGKIIQRPETFVYYAFYKPRGIECTLNPGVENNLFEILPFKERVYPVGRLDKESEGLLLLTNDGTLYRSVAASENLKEKEYEVQVNKELNDEIIAKLAAGIIIMGKKTRPAVVTKINAVTFRIILTQGLNRQIRRMCYKLGYNVTSLKRIRIAAVPLAELNPGEYRKLNRAEIDQL